jgi:hypothetical protein
MSMNMAMMNMAMNMAIMAMNNRKKTFLMYYHVPSLVPWLECERSVNMG